jgi:glucose-6-phosphate 1-epimerase
MTVVAHSDTRHLAAADGLVRMRNTAGDFAAVSLYGGQVLSWRTADCCERLYRSPQAQIRGRAVRGGVPVCFPQFANRGPLVKHGFARTSWWQLVRAPETNHDTGVVRADLVLANCVQSKIFWPYEFRLELQVSLGKGWLEIALHVINTGDCDFEFTGALHTYLAVTDVHNATLVGLEQASYIGSLEPLDSYNKEVILSKTSTPLKISGELDRIYLKSPSELQLRDCEIATLNIVQSGFRDTVVWNPGPAKSAALGDMPAADWQRMLCVEAAQVEQPVVLQPGHRWLGSQRLVVCKISESVQ